MAQQQTFTFVATYDSFCEQVRAKFMDALTSYNNATMKSMFGQFLDNSIALMKQLHLFTDTHAQLYKTSTKNRRVFFITNMSPAENEVKVCQNRFCRTEMVHLHFRQNGSLSSCRTVPLCTEALEALQAVFYHFDALDIRRQVRQAHPDFETKLAWYDGLYTKTSSEYGDRKECKAALRAFFADTNNWPLIKDLVKWGSLSWYFFPVPKFYCFFPYENSSDEAFAFFVDIYKYHAKERYYEIGKMFRITYAYPRYFWYILRDQWCDAEAQEDALFDRMYRFPLDPETLEYLVAFVQSKPKPHFRIFHTRDRYSTIFRNLCPSHCTQEQYVGMVDRMCGILGIPIAPALHQLIEWARSTKCPKNELQNCLRVFYTHGYYHFCAQDVIALIATLQDKFEKEYYLGIQAILDTLGQEGKAQLLRAHKHEPLVARWLKPQHNFV